MGEVNKYIHRYYFYTLRNTISNRPKITPYLSMIVNIIIGFRGICSQFQVMNISSSPVEVQMTFNFIESS
uniref:Uncharacterized protein n=1 Tax=Lepeophtheirus salmonis TaxID=72036 RepID=A0A0K2UX20_LEPSM